MYFISRGYLSYVKNRMSNNNCTLFDVIRRFLEHCSNFIDVQKLNFCSQTAVIPDQAARYMSCCCDLMAVQVFVKPSISPRFHCQSVITTSGCTDYRSRDMLYKSRYVSATKLQSNS